MEIKITVRKVQLSDGDDIQFDYYRDGKNRHSWWLGTAETGREILPNVINMFGEIVKQDLKRFIEDS